MEKTVFYLIIAGIGLILLAGIIVLIIFLTKKSSKASQQNDDNNSGNTCVGFGPDNYVIGDSNSNMLSLVETDQKDQYKVVMKGINIDNPPFLCPLYDSNNTIKALDLYYTYSSDGQLLAYCKGVPFVRSYYLNITDGGNLTLSYTKQNGAFKLYCNDIDSNNNFEVYIQDQNTQKYFMESNNNISLTPDSHSATKFLFKKKTLGITDTTNENNDGSCSCKNYCGFNWGNWNSNYNWSGASCELGLLDDGTVIDCNTSAGQHTTCVCSQQNSQGFKGCNRNQDDSCNTGCPADNDGKCNC
jgi:hypothetical protein